MVLPPVELAQLHESELNGLGLLGVEGDLVDDAGDGAHIRVLELGDLRCHLVLRRAYNDGFRCRKN